MGDEVIIEILYKIQNRLKKNNLIAAILRIIIGAYERGLLYELVEHCCLFVKEQNEIREKSNSEDVKKH